MKPFFVLWIGMLIFSSHLMAGKEALMLSQKEKSLIEISAFTANGDLQTLKKSFEKGLNAGLSISEIKEAIVHLYAYTGFPRSLNSLTLFMQTVDERKKVGIHDTIGKKASPLPKNYNANEYGANVRATLAGLKTDISGAAWQAFSPEMDRFLKEHLFGDIFVRDVLDYKMRELVTISALSAMNGTQGQLKFHFLASMHVGMTHEKLKQFIVIIKEKVGADQAKIAEEVLITPLKNKLNNQTAA